MAGRVLGEPLQTLVRTWRRRDGELEVIRITSRFEPTLLRGARYTHQHHERTTLRTPIHMPTRYPDIKFDSDYPGASLSKPPVWLPPAPHGPSWSRFRRFDSTGRPREVRISTCAARLGSPPRGAHSAGESRAREGWRAGILRIGPVSAIVPLRTCPAARSRLL